MNTRLFLSLLTLTFSLTLISCGSESANSDSAAASAESETPAGTPMPGLPVETLENVFNRANFADYIFYQPSFSMNQDEVKSVQMALGFIGSQPATMKASCQPSGRVFFQDNGEDILIADIYLADGCNYFVFLENEKPKYANMMTAQGIQYLNNNINQVLDMQRQAQQGQGQ